MTKTRLDAANMTRDLFTPPAPPANPYKRENVTGHAAHDALVAVAYRRWAHKQEYERMVSGLTVGRGGEWPVGETPGRYLRFLREKYRGTGWTIINRDGDVCLCLESERDEMMGGQNG